MDNASLNECLVLLQVGNKAAFIKLYEEFKKPVYTVIFRIVGSKETAEDITQELFIKLYTHPPGEFIYNPRAWIFGMARNMAIDTLRRHKCGEVELLEDI